MTKLTPVKFLKNKPFLSNIPFPKSDSQNQATMKIISIFHSKILFLCCLISLQTLTAQTNTSNIDSLFEKAKESAYAKEYEQSIQQLQNILSLHNNHFDAQLMLARVLAWSEKYDASLQQIETVLEDFPQNEEALTLQQMVKKWKAANQEQDFNEHIQLNYGLDLFRSNQSKWKSFSLEYQRSVPDMPVSVRYNYASRFGLQGGQFEVEAYPKFSKRNYGYLSLAYSDSKLFANYTMSASLFHNIKNDLEIEGGFRYVLFDSNTPILVGVTSIGKYTKDFWFNYRFSMVKANRFDGTLHRFRVRKYLQNQHNYIFIDATLGITERDLQALQVLNGSKSHTQNVQIGMVKGLSKRLFLTASMGYEQTKYSEEKKNSVFSTNLAFTYKF